MLKPKLVISIIAAILILRILAHYDELIPYRWQTVKAPDGVFSVLLPTKPEFKDQQIQLRSGQTATVHMVIATPNQETTYACSYFEDPTIDTKSTEQVLDTVRDDSVAKVQGSIISQRNLFFDGHPALEFRVRARENTFANNRLIIVGKRLFHLAVADGRSETDSKNVRKFFDSLKFGN